MVASTAAAAKKPSCSSEGMIILDCQRDMAGSTDSKQWKACIRERLRKKGLKEGIGKDYVFVRPAPDSMGLSPIYCDPKPKDAAQEDK